MADFDLGVRHLRFLPDNRHVLGATMNPFNGTSLGFHIWDAHTGEGLRQFGKESSPSSGIALSAHGTTPLLGRWGRSGRMDVKTGAALARRELSDAVDAAAVDAGGGTGLTAGAKGAIHLWRLHRSDLVRATRMTDEGTAGRFAISSDSRYLAAATDFRVEDLGSWQFLGDSQGEGDENPIRIQDVQTGLPLMQLRHHRRGMRHLAFGVADDLLSLDATGTIVRWDLATGSVTDQWPLNADGFRISPDGQWMLVRVSERPVTLYSLPSRGGARIPMAVGPTGDIAFSADARAVVIASSDGTIEVFEVSGGQSLQHCREPTAWRLSGHVSWLSTATCSVPAPMA